MKPSDTKRVFPRAEWLYRLLLFSYPATFRRAHGEEMRLLFRDQLRERFARRGWLGLALLWAPMLRDVVVNAALLRFETSSNDVTERRSHQTFSAWLQSVGQDSRFALRAMRKRSGLAAVVILTLALGIGVNTAIFSIVNAVLLRPLPYEDAERLVLFKASEANKESNSFSYPDIKDLRERQQSFTQLAAIRSGGWTLTEAGDAERLPGARVSAEFFPMLGIKPVAGRVFSPEEDRPGAARVVMLHYSLWQRRFGGDPDIVGRQLTLNGAAHTVIGVLPPEFHFFPVEISIAEMYGTLAHEGDRLNRRESRFLAIIGKRKDGVTLPRAQADVSAIATRLAEQFPLTNAKRVMKLVDLREQVIGNVRLALWVLLGSVLCVLLIACANAANLLLTAAAARQKEMAVRAALGASRMRVLRLLLTESLFLAAGGGVCGLLLAQWTIRLLALLKPEGLPRLSEINLDGRVLLFTGAVVALTSLVFGLAPAWQATKFNLSATLKEGGRSGAGPGSARLRRGLVVAEVALAFVLLVGAGLLLNSFARLMQVDLGFNPQNVLKLTVALPATQYAGDAQKIAFMERALERLKALPGVEAAAAANVTPLTGYAANLPFDIENRPPALPGEQPNAEYRAVSADYFRALGMRLRRGRLFTEQDVKQTRAAVINEELARHYWPNEDPLGKRLRLARADEPWREVIGVVGDIKQTAVEAAPLPELYEPTLRNAAGFYDIVVRSSVSPESLTQAARAEFRALDPNLPLFTIRTLAVTVQLNLARQRFAMQLLGAFALLALALAAIGLYGVLSYAVSQRTREIGLRMALGARAGDVIRMTLKESMRLVMIGAGLGFALSLAAGRVMTNLLYGVTATDPLTIACALALLGAVSLSACWLPARRAAKADPMAALRAE
jgi:putative ABC transport system permease protein